MIVDVQETSPDMKLIKVIPLVTEVSFKALQSQLSHIVQHGIHKT